VRTLRRLLGDGLRLAFGLRPRATPLNAGFARWGVLALLALALDTALEWHRVEAPRMFDPNGLQTALAAGLLRLAASAVLCAMTQRRALFWTVAAWLEAASLPVALLTSGFYLDARDGALPLLWWIWVLSLVWTLLILLRLALFLHPKYLLRAIPAAGFALAIQIAPWFVLEPQQVVTTDWEARYTADGDAEEWREPGTLDAPETTIYAQAELLSRTLNQLAQQRPGRIDLYALAFGGDASEDVFRNEVEYVERLMPQRFDASGHTLTLLNHPDTSATRPLATTTNLERALLGLGERMDHDEDILFLYLTSHGSEEHEIYVNQPPLPLDQLTPQRLRAALDAAGIRWRVLVISACYSGGYIDALRDPGTLVITASGKDRSSFGCGADSEITWFGKAFLSQALNATVDFPQAFQQAREQIVAWEREEEIEASHPQIEIGEHIVAQLDRWRAQFVPGAPLPFTVPPTDRETPAP